jgi:hypothetical protein
MIDALALTINDGLLETECGDQKADESARVAGTN